MKIHHLNCATMCPYGGKLITGSSGKASICCHCLLIEGEDALVLVDTGFGLDDVRHPYRQMGPPFAAAFRPQASEAETAIEQIRHLGLDPVDVRHIVPTHLDLDHAGGLPDFPAAEVHLFRPEHDAAMKPSLRDRARYPRAHFAHGPNWNIHAVEGDSWFGFESLKVLPGLGTDVVLVPLTGHSRGHTGVAVRDGSGWMLHCGDAYFHHAEVADPPECPSILRMFQAAMAADRGARHKNQERLRKLVREHSDEVRVFCAHDAVELAREQAAA